MSYGLRLYDSNGNLRLDTNDRCLRFVASLNIVGYADSTANASNLSGAGNAPWRCHFNNIFNINYPDIVNDGTWVIIITKLPSPRSSAGASQPGTFMTNYVTAYPTIEKDNIKINIVSLWDYYKSSLSLPAGVFTQFTSGTTANFSFDIYRM